MDRAIQIRDGIVVAGDHGGAGVRLHAGGLLAGSDSRAQSRRRLPPFSITYIAAWGVKGNEPGQLDEPTDIATDSLGNIYFADAGTHFVDKFTWEGRPLLAFRGAAAEVSGGDHG